MVANNQDLLYDLILETICETVQQAVDAGKDSETGGRLAIEKIIDRGWSVDFLQRFGASLARDIWRQYSVRPDQARLRRGLRRLNESDPPAPPTLPPSPSPEPLAVEPASLALSPMGAVPSPQPASGEGHSRESAVSILSKDIEDVLRTKLTVAGLWARVGELHRKDILQLSQEKRERALNHVLGMKRERQALERIARYFQDDWETLRAVVASGRLNQDELREAFGSVR